VGTYSILPSGTNSNYAITYIAANLTVGKKDLIVSGGRFSSVYGSDPGQVPYTVTGLVSPDTKAIIDNLGASTPADSLSDVGEYPTQVTGSTTDSNYKLILKDGVHRVDPAPLYFRAIDTTKVYGASVPSLPVEITGWLNGDDPTQVSGVSVNTPAQGSSPVGKYSLEPRGDSLDTNYQPVYLGGQLTVTKAPLFVAAEDATKTYGQGNPIFTPLSVVGLVNGDTQASLGYWAKTPATVFSPAGNYPLVPIISNPNYEPTFRNGIFNVRPAPLTIIAKDATRGYGQSNPSFEVTVSGLVGWDTPVSIKELGATSIATRTSKIGSYQIVPKGINPNYQISYVSATLEVTPAVLVIAAKAQSKYYGDPNPILSTMVTGLVNSDKESDIQGLGAYTTALTGSNAGLYPIRATGSNQNYVVKLVDSTLTVNPAPLSIIADDKSVVRNVDSMPALTWHADGFKNGDTLAILSGVPKPQTVATPSSDLGTYPITLGLWDVSAVNYKVVGVNGTFTVAPVTKTAIPVGTTPVIVPAVIPGSGILVYGSDNKLIAALNPYPGYRGPISTVVADLDGDGVMDITTAPGTGHSPIVKSYSGRTLGQISSFAAYAQNFMGGVTLSVGDLTGDGKKEIITGTGQGSAQTERRLPASLPMTRTSPEG
jgi:hypothetical protein